MTFRTASVLLLFFTFGFSFVQSNEESRQFEIMLKLISQNQTLNLSSGDSLFIWVQTETDSLQSNYQMDMLQRVSKNSSPKVTSSFTRIQSTKEALSFSTSPDAVLFLNSKTTPLSQEIRDWHRLGVVTLTNNPDYMDIGVSIAVQKDSTGQQIIFLNPRALEQAGARFSTDVLQLTKTRYARGREL